MKLRFAFSLLIALALGVPFFAVRARPAAATPSYTVVDLGPLQRASGINNSGQVVGFGQTADPGTRALLWQEGSVQDLGSLHNLYTFSEAQDINDDGQVVGISRIDSSGAYHVFVWQHGVMADLGIAVPLSLKGFPYAINSSGQVAGTEGDWTTQAAFLWTPGVAGGTKIALGTLGGTFSTADGINAIGQVVGRSTTASGIEHAYVWTPSTPNGVSGTMQELSSVSGSGAYDINDSGQAVGEANSHPFLWGDGVTQDLGRLSVGGYARAHAINNHGQIVGFDQDNLGVARAFLYEGGALTDLNTLLPVNSGWQLRIAWDINDAGYIVGEGVHNGVQHAFLLKPAASPPTVAVDNATVAVTEGVVATNSGTYADPDAGDNVVITASAGVITKTGTNGGTWNWSLSAGDGPTSQVVTITADDGHGGIATTTFTLNVANVAPVVDLGQDASVAEGQTFSHTGTFTDPGADTWTATVDYGDGTSIQPLAVNPDQTFNLSHAYADDGIYTITVTVTDDDGGIGTGMTSVTVANVAPVVGTILAPISPVQIGTAIDTSAPFTDPGARDIHTATWDWGDGTNTAGTVSETNGSGTVNGSHTYANAGVYTVSLTVQDKDGGASTATFQYVVAYDPNGGFVTGAGWITSPAGACKLTVCTADTTGKANFGFVAKYQSGATVPSGQTQFQFKAGGLDFESTAYDWLVVAGSKAQFKGTGTINDSGSYGFMLTALDGSPDRFRIKIWDNVTGAVVYDNQMGQDDNGDPTTTLGGGAIQVHK